MFCIPVVLILLAIILGFIFCVLILIIGASAIDMMLGLVNWRETVGYAIATDWIAYLRRITDE